MDPALSQVIDRIRAAAADAAPLRIRGGGTKDFYGEPPGAAAGEVLDTRGLAGVTSYEPSELVVTARAGTPLAELEALLATRGQCLPFEPPHFGTGATVGGMVAAGLAGPARASVGSVRDYVLGLSLVNGRGEWLTFGGQVMKNVAGYDVSRLMAGALGTLGLVTEVSLKVLPVAPAEATLRFALGQAEALDRLSRWGGRPLPLNASRWCEDAPGLGVLHLRLRGAVAAVEAACQALLAEQPGEPLDRDVAAGDWTRVREQQDAWFAPREGQDLWRLSVPQTAPVLDLPGPVFVEWHGGQRWLHAAREQADAVRAATRAAGGHATLFRAGTNVGTNAGTNAAPAGGRFAPLTPPLDRIHRELKRQFDPAGLFNRGRLYPDL